MSEYSMKAKSWIYSHLNNFSDRLPSGYSKPDIEKMNDEQLYGYSHWLYDVIEHGQGGGSAQNPGKQQLYIVPHEESDGSVMFTDRYSGKIVAGSQRMPNGLFAYFGPKDMLEVFFGRSGLDKMWDRTADNMYFSDAKRER